MRTLYIEFERDLSIGLDSTFGDDHTDTHTHTHRYFFLKHIFRLWEWCRMKNHKKKCKWKILTIAILPSLLMSLESKKFEKGCFKLKTTDVLILSLLLFSTKTVRKNSILYNQFVWRRMMSYDWSALQETAGCLSIELKADNMDWSKNKQREKCTRGWHVLTCQEIIENSRTFFL